MRVLITGIAGFIGSNLAAFILESGKAEIFGTVLPGESLHGLESIKGRIRLFDCDITNASQLEKIVSESKPDFVFHFAAQPNVYLSWGIPEKTMVVNVLGTLNLLEALRKHAPDARVLLSSSREVYGAVKKNELPISESQSPRPANPYAVSKLTMEMLGMNYLQKYGLKVIIFRSFNITGPGRPKEFACSDWAKQLAEIELGLKEPVLETGSVGAVRDFTDVRDAVRAFWLGVQKCKPGEIYNLCSGKGHEMKEVLATVLSLSCKKISVESKKEKIVQIDVPYAVGRNAKLRKATGWKPEIKLEKTLSDLAECWKRELSA
jgi:GDP-4-dehydro-6-deoxy-D-mannose reductase